MFYVRLSAARVANKPVALCSMDRTVYEYWLMDIYVSQANPG